MLATPLVSNSLAPTSSPSTTNYFGTSKGTCQPLALNCCALVPRYPATHIWTVSSLLPEAMRLPSGDQATALTTSEWPR